MTTKMMQKVIIFLILIAIAIFLNFQFDIIDNYDIEKLSQFNHWIQSWGWLAPGLFVLIYGFAQVIFLPNPFFMIVAGLAFGPILGMLVSLIGFSLGSSLSFLIARYLAKDTVEYWLEKRDIATNFKQWFDEHGYRLLIMTRSIPIIPVNLQNYTYGLTDIGFLNYIILSIIATMPKIIFLAGISGLFIEVEFKEVFEEHMLALVSILSLVGIMYFIIYKFFWIEKVEFKKE